MHAYKKIAQSLRWNTIEAVVYQLLLFAHQLFLFRMVAATTYGLIGTSFAITFLIAGFVSGGFEYAITPFFTEASASRNAYRRLIVYPFLNHMATIFVMIGLIIAPLYYWHFYYFLPLEYGSFIILLALAEGIRKILKVLAQLAFKARQGAYIEIISLIIYLTIVWTAYWYGFGITIPLLFTPLIITSSGASIFYMIIIFRWYQELTPTTLQLPLEKKRLWRSRIMNFIHQSGHAIFSSNFLVPWIALHAGLEQAGIFKIFSHACYLITPIIQRIFGLSGQVLFAHMKQYTVAEKIQAVIDLNKKLLKVLFVLLVLLIVNIKTLITINNFPLTSPIPLLSVSFFIMLLLSENLVIIYEKFCIAEERVHYLVIYGLVSFVGFSVITCSFCASSLITTLIGLLVVRLCSFGILAWLMFNAWKIKPPATLHGSYIAALSALGIIMYLFS